MYNLKHINRSIEYHTIKDKLENGPFREIIEKRV